MEASPQLQTVGGPEWVKRAKQRTEALTNWRAEQE
jgi:hypothetical protein